MKKYIGKLLVFTMMLFALTACSSNPPEPTPAPEGESAPVNDAESVDTNTPADADTSGGWEYIADKGEMIIGITYFEPMNYLDESGTLTGFETDFATEVCGILGVTPKFQEISWSAKETELNAKNIDCIWNGMTINDTLKQNTSLSRPYMQNKQIVVVKSENAAAYAESLEGKNVVAEEGSAGGAVCNQEEFFSNANYIPVGSQAKALMEVAAGTADACVIDYVMSIGMIGEGTDFADLTVIQERGFGEEEYGIAMRKQDTEFTAKVNDAIQQLIDNGRLTEIAETYKLAELLIVE